jgi:S-adenosylmethionine decarboxylase
MRGGKKSRMHTPADLNGSRGRLRRLEAGRLNVHPATANGASAPRAAAVGFGPHLVFDGFGCPAERLGDLSSLYRLLDGLPDRIRMTKIMPPYVFRHGLPGRSRRRTFRFRADRREPHQPAHVSGTRIRERRRVLVRDVRRAGRARGVRDTFGPSRVEWKLLDRGREFPKHIAASRAIVAGDRRVVARGLGLEASR